MKIKIKVIPKSSRAQITEDLEGHLRVKLKSAPVQGKANKELIELLARHYQVAKSQIKIIKGQTSKNKTVDIKYP